MITSTLAKTKDHLSSLLRKVQAGETLIILDRKTPIARVERILSPSLNPHLVAPKAEWSPDKILNLPKGQLKSGAESLVSTVIAERESGW